MLDVQLSIDQAIIALQSGISNDASKLFEVSMQRHPYPPYENDEFLSSLSYYLPITITLSYIFIAPVIVLDIVSEKQLKLKVKNLSEKNLPH